MWHLGEQRIDMGDQVQNVPLMVIKREIFYRLLATIQVGLIIANENFAHSYNEEKNV